MFKPEKIIAPYQPDNRKRFIKSKAGITSLIIVWLVAGWTLAGAFIMFGQRDAFEGWVGLVSLLIFLFFQLVLPKLAGMSNPDTMRNIISATMVSSLSVGRYFYLYSRVEYFDKSQHVLYGMVIVLTGLLIFYRLTPAKERENIAISPAILWIWLTGFAMLVLFTWEIFEFFGDRMFGSDMQAWKSGPISGLTDTMMDLVTGFVGAALMASLAVFSFRQDRAIFYRRWLAGCFHDESTGFSTDSKRVWLLSPVIYLSYIGAALIIYALAARVWQPTYMVKSMVKILLFAFVPIFVSRYYTLDLSWLRINFQDTSVRKACLRLSGVGLAAVIAAFALSKPLGLMFGVEKIMAEIMTRTRTPELLVWFALLYIPIFNASIEEIFFRGFIFRALAGKISSWSASLLSAFIFAAYHLIVFRNWFNLPLLFIALLGLAAAGLFLNRLVAKYDSLLPAWIIHGLINVAIFMVAVPYI